MITQEQIKMIIDLVGRDGAHAALVKSSKVSENDLQELLRGSSTNEIEIIRIKKSKLVEKLISILSPEPLPIDRSLDDLLCLSEDEIVRYLHENGGRVDQIEKYLIQNKIPYRPGLSRPKLIAAAARQISLMGRYERIANVTDTASASSIHMSKDSTPKNGDICDPPSRSENFKISEPENLVVEDRENQGSKP